MATMLGRHVHIQANSCLEATVAGRQNMIMDAQTVYGGRERLAS